MIKLPIKPLFYLGGIFFAILVFINMNDYMLRQGYKQIEKLPTDWPGSVTGKKSCKSDQECGDCGLSPNTFPKGINCQCLVAFNKCGLGRIRQP